MHANIFCHALKDILRVEMLMELGAYSVKELQQVSALLTLFDQTTLVGEVVKAVNAALQDRLAAVVTVPENPPDQQATPYTSLCPSCGRPTFYPAATIEGLRRYGCKACKYSAVVGGV